MGILGVPRAFCYAVGATYVTKYFLPPKCRLIPLCPHPFRPHPPHPRRCDDDGAHLFFQGAPCILILPGGTRAPATSGLWCTAGVTVGEQYDVGHE